MDQHRAEMVRWAIEIMTAWASEPGGGPFAGDRVEAIVKDRGQGDAFAGLLDAFIGMVNLSGLLLVYGAEHSGKDEAEILQEIARRTL